MYHMSSCHMSLLAARPAVAAALAATGGLRLNLFNDCPLLLNNTWLLFVVLLQVLQHWLALLQQGEQLRQLAEQLQQLLAQRSSSLGSDAAAAGMLAMAAVSTRVGAAGEAMQLQQLQQVTQEMVAQVSQLLQVSQVVLAEKCDLKAVMTFDAASDAGDGGAGVTAVAGMFVDMLAVTCDLGSCHGMVYDGCLAVE
jgi:hypothetical protein